MDAETAMCVGVAAELEGPRRIDCADVQVVHWIYSSKKKI